MSARNVASAFVPAGGHEVIATGAFLRAEVPSVNGVFTARALARLYAALGSDDGVDGVQLWSPATRAAASKQQNSRRDRVIPLKVGWRLGYHQPCPKKKTASNSFGFYGSYGSGPLQTPVVTSRWGWSANRRNSSHSPNSSGRFCTPSILFGQERTERQRLVHQLSPPISGLRVASRGKRVKSRSIVTR